MSYLHEKECFCLASYSAEQESPISISATLNAEPACLNVVVTTSSEMLSPCREIEVSLDYEVGVDDTGPYYNIIVYHPELNVGDILTIDGIEYTVTNIVGTVEELSEDTNSNTEDPNCIDCNCPDDQPPSEGPYYVTIFSLSGPAFLEDGVAILTVCGSSTLPNPISLRGHSFSLESNSDIDELLSGEIGFNTILNVFSEIEDGLTVIYSVNQSLENPTTLNPVFLDKFYGDFPDYFDLQNYDNTQKLFPSGDVLTSDFIASDDSTTNLYSYIEEGIFIGEYTTPSGYTELITDDLNTYITPNTAHTEGVFAYKAYLDTFTVKPQDTRFLIRLSAPLNNLESRIAPRYTIRDIKFEDLAGNLITEYENVTFFGDASDDQGDNKFNNFTTFSLKPKNNVVANKYAWQEDYPDLHQKNGYTVSFNILAEALDDAFTEGFNLGFADLVASGNLFPELIPTNSVRISALEIWNSGFPGIGPSPEDYLGLVVMPPEKGKRLERKIRPTFIPKYGFDTTIFPESGNLLWTDHNGIYSNIDECDNSKLISYLTDGKDHTFITTHEAINDSGKLILKFSTGSSDVSEVTPGAFNVAFDQSINDIWTSPTFSDGRFHPSGAFNTENTVPLNQNDNIFFGIDSVSLSVTAKKSPGTRDFFLDVVGYSDDCILNTTTPVGGFLQHPSGEVEFIAPVSSGFANIDDLGIDGEAISDKFAYFESSLSGDHYELTKYPLVDSEEFRTYELPLKIFTKEVELGLPPDYNWSRFFEHLYLDIYPLPSGTSISDIHLIVRYKPQNAFNLATQGGDIGRLQPGRSEGGFYPTSRSADDDYLNAGTGYYPLSTILNIPHQYRSPETLKTNYSRRWRGIKGLTYGPYNVNEFGFDFLNYQLDSPIIDCLIDFSKLSGYTFTSRDLKLVDTITTDFSRNGVDTVPERYQNIGLRFTDDSMFSSILPGYTSDYITADWTALSNGPSNFQNHELYGQIFDGYDNVVRFDIKDKLLFTNVNAHSGIVLYARFIPDANVSGEGYNLYDRSMVYNLYDSPLTPILEIGFSGGHLYASGNGTTGSEIVVDSNSYSDYQYPLSVLVTYDNKHDRKLRLYTDNELHKGEFNNLRGTSNPIELPNIDATLTFGYGDNSISGFRMLACELGFSNPFISSGCSIVESEPDRNLKQISAREFFDNQRSKFFDPGESHTNDTYKLWDYVNEDSYNDWSLGDFENPVFSPAFSTLIKRSGRDLVSFYLEHDGNPYINRTDLTLPSNINSGVSYHSQIENDFLRFHLTDTVNNFYSTYPRISKNLPQGYSFYENALIVDTIIQHESSGNINWDRCTVGPKLIVSLYSKNQEPYWGGENYGLLNRSTHYLDPAPSAIIKLESTFNYKDVCDESEEWALFPKEQVIKDFKERIFSEDIDDMYLQYDVVYPSSDGFMSKIQIHSAHVRAENAFITPLPSSGQLNIFSEGILGVENVDLNLFVDAVSGVIQESGLALYVSGEQPIVHSGQINLYAFGVLGTNNDSLTLFCDNTALDSGSLNLYTSGKLPIPVSGNIDLFTHGKATLSTEEDEGDEGGGIKGLALTLFNPEILKGSGNNGLDLFVFAPLSENLIIGSSHGGAVDWSAIRSGPFKLFAFNDHSSARGLGDLTEALLLSTIGDDELSSNFRTSYHPLYMSGSQILTADSSMPLFLQGLELVETQNFDSINLSLYNIHGSAGVSFNWDGYDYGVGIDARDNDLSSLSLDNEIRGLNTVGYGNCSTDSPRKAFDEALVTDNVVWRERTCVDAGIFRAFTTYTNPSVEKAFDELPGSYSGNYYDIRKYTGLHPYEAYFVTMEIETGNTEGIDQPRDWEEWEYGICGPSYGPDACCTEDCDQDINFSGIKLISDVGSEEALGTDDSRNAIAHYGKSVSVKENLMGVGAPGLTIYDEYGNAVPSGGAVFLYRRNADVAGKKANWELERKLTLPSGFIRDYVASATSNGINYPTVGPVEFSIPFQQWDIGQEGREFGHSMSLCSSGERETVVVGAPGASWSRTFADLNVSGIPICMAVFTDKFKNDEKAINRIASEARVYDVLYNYFAEKWDIDPFTFNPRLDIKLLIYHFVDYTSQRNPVTIKQDFATHTYVNLLSNSGFDPRVTGGFMTGEEYITEATNVVKSTFLDTFRISNTAHSGLPPIMGVFVEKSASTRGGADINPVAERFINFYQPYIYQSGVVDPETSLPDSGYYNKIVDEAENWDVSSINLLRETLATGNLIDNDALRYIASGFSSNANPALGAFQLPPSSGGKVYIFDNEDGEINLVQEIKTYLRRETTLQLDNSEDLDQLMNLEMGGKDYHDRFGHAVDISENGKIITIGSPFTPRPCEVFERIDSENDRMYQNIRDWFVHADGKHDYNGLDNVRFDFQSNIDRYDELLELSGVDIARRQSYKELNPSDKFFYRTDKSFWGINTIELYKKIYDYKYEDIPYRGTWNFLPVEFAPTSRLGYSCAVNEDGSIVAFGAPTDSFNEFDDFNVWYGGTTDFGSGNNRWASMTNAGAVRLFESRTYYNHSGVVEFTRFGNLDRVLNEGKDNTAYDRMTDYFGADIPGEQSKPRSFRRMDFSEKTIPQNAGLAFIITPERDVISEDGGEEILEGIKEWLSLGDRTLVLVANDPQYEDGGIYRRSTEIVNTILDKLGSRMLIQAARSEEEASLGCFEIGNQNIIQAFQPEYNHTTFSDYTSNISTDPIYAHGVADIKIRLKDEEISIFKDSGVQMPCNGPEKILNPEPELPIKQFGDLRAQWNSICSACGPGGCIEIEYKTNWPMYFNNPNPSQACDQYPLVGNIDSPYEDPRPILTVAARTPDQSWFVPASSYIEIVEEPIFSSIVTEANTSRTFLSDTHLDELSFNIFEKINNENKIPEGTYNSFNIGSFTNPDTYNFRNPILQGKGEVGDPIMVRDGQETEIVSEDSPLVCEETPDYAGNNSRVVMIASTRPETILNLSATEEDGVPSDKNRGFYSNIVKFDCNNPGSIYQIGGWTGRESFADVISDFEMGGAEGESYIEDTKSHLSSILIKDGHSIQENVTSTVNYAYANVLWIADPLGYDEDQVAEIADFLRLDNKTVVITYNIQPTVYEVDDFGEIIGTTSEPYDTIKNVTKICDKLQLNMRPAYSDLIGNYVSTNSTVDTSPQVINYNYDSVSGCVDGFKWTGMENYIAEYTYIDYLNAYLEPFDNPGRRNDFNFVPIIGLPNSKEVIKYEEPISVSKPKYVENTYFTMNAESSVTFPVIENSGYRVFVNYVSETADDKITTSCAVASNSEDGGEFGFAELAATSLGQVKQQQFDIDAGEGATELSVSFNASSSELIDDVDVFVEPRSVRIVSISGCPLPKITETTTTTTTRTVIIGFTRTENEVIIPARSGIIPGEFGPFSSNREQYLPPGLLDCDNVTTKTLIEDGPVVVAEELENFSSFSSGKRKSRIVVITDPTIVEGRCPHYRDDALGGNQKFLRSLYLPSPNEYRDEQGRLEPNEEYYDTSTKFEYIQKIRSPETGSPGKYYSKVNEHGLTRRFGEPGLYPVAGNETLYRTDEDSFAPEDVYRKKNPPFDQIKQETDKFIGYIEDDYGIYPSFSGAFLGYGPLTDEEKDHAGIPRFRIDENGNLIEINLIYYPKDQTIGGGITTIQKLSGRDYLDYIDSFSGYPGDLFGYSIDLKDKKLIVGTPFNGYTAGRVWDWTEISGDPLFSGLHVSEYGGAGAAYFFERTGQGENAQSEFLPFQFKTKIKPDSANVGISGGLTNVNILNQKNILLERHSDHTDEDFKQTDQFGRSVAVASDMFAIGAPNHDWSTEHLHIYDGSSAFLRKSFTNEFDIPQHQFPETNEDPVLNNGAIYTYRHDLVDFAARKKEVVFAEKINEHGYNARFASNGTDGTENDKFGISVDMHRSFRGDSDYTLVGGATNHDFPTSGTHKTGIIKNAGAVFTNDAMLRRQPKVIPVEGGYISAKIFGSTNNDNLSMTVAQPVSGLPEIHQISGILFSNKHGEIFIEGSGFDPATKGFTIHRPFVKYVAGKVINGTPANENIDLFMKGEPGVSSSDMPLFIQDLNGGYVYNNINLYSSGNIDYASGNLELYVSGDRFFDSGIMELFTSGSYVDNSSLDLRIRGK